MNRKRFLLCGSYALYLPFLRVAEFLCRSYDLEGHVLAPESPLPTSYHPLASKVEGAFDLESTPLRVHLLPARKNDAERYGFSFRPLHTLLHRLRPDYLWIQGEFWGGLSHQLLGYYRLSSQPSIVSYVAVNHISRPTPLWRSRWPFLSRTRLKQLLLWPRLNGVAACATAAQECARRLGLPNQVPVIVNYFPVLGPEEAAGNGLYLPWNPEDSFIVGFAGMLTEQKGWRIMLQALESLPEVFKVVIAGDGEDKQELLRWLERPGLKGRAFFAGWLPKRQLLRVYSQFDVLVLPSLTTARSVEQFGAVLAEAMACGVPVIGSTSGAIPETVNQAGFLVSEGDPEALSQALLTIKKDESLRQRCSALGRERYQKLYSCMAYAHSMATIFRVT